MNASAPAVMVTIRALIQGTNGDKLLAIEKGLKIITLSDLGRRFMRARIVAQTALETGRKVPSKTRLHLWLFNQEYTRRGIPPVLRNLPTINDDDPEHVADCFAIDLQWLAARYPDKATFYKKWQGIFKLRSFHSTADWISSHYPRRDIWWFCKGLSLTDEQQRELSFIKRIGLRRAFDQLTNERDAVKAKLSAAYHQRDGRYKTSDHEGTINRRLAIWYVGSLAAWRPQRTAELYAAYTGDLMTRQLAANIMEQVWRDVPESRP